MSTAVRRMLLSLPLMALALGTVSVRGEQAAFDTAASAYRQGDWETAATQFQNLLSNSNDPTSAEQIRFFLAECEMQLGQYASAQQNYQSVREFADQELSARALFRCGEAALFAGDDQLADDLLHQYLSANPDSASAAFAWMYLGDLANRRGDLETAAAAFRTVAKDHSHSPNADSTRLALAKVFLARGEYDQVPQVLTSISEDGDPSISAEAALLTGRAMFEQGEYEQSLARFRQVIENYPQTETRFRARIAAAWALWRLEQFSAIRDEVKPLANQPHWLADYHYLLGMAAYGQQDWSAGTKQLAKALALRPDHPSHDAMLFYQGLCYSRGERLAAAESVWERLCAEHPNSTWRDDALWELSRMARLKQDTQQYNSRVQTLRQEVPASDYITSFYDQGDNTQTHNTPAQIDRLAEAQDLLDEAVGLERDGHFHRAIASYEELIALTPANSLVHEGIWRNAKLHQRLKRNRQAMRLHEQYLRSDPTSSHLAESHAALGTLALSGGNKGLANKHFQVLLEKFPQSAQAAGAAYWLARLAADDNDSEKALEYLDATLAMLEQLESPHDREKNILAQAVVLKSKLLAENENWPEVRNLAVNALSKLQQGTAQVKLEFWLAEAEFRTEEFDQARNRFEELQPRTAGIQEAWVAMVPLRRAQLFAQRLQWKEVLTLLEKLEESHPNFALQYEVDYLRGRALAGRGQMRAARTYYEEVLQNPRSSAETSVAAQWMIGETYFHQQNYETARLTYQQVIDDHDAADWQARAALQIGKCWELEQNWDKARATYTRAMTNWPDTQTQQQLETRLRWAQRHGNPRR